MQKCKRTQQGNLLNVQLNQVNVNFVDGDGGDGGGREKKFLRVHGRTDRPTKDRRRGPRGPKHHPVCFPLVVPPGGHHLADFPAAFF